MKTMTPVVITPDGTVKVWPPLTVAMAFSFHQLVSTGSGIDEPRAFELARRLQRRGEE
jgi:hypothetical protein